MERLDPHTIYVLRQLVRVHGADRIVDAIRTLAVIEREARSDLDIIQDWQELSIGTAEECRAAQDRIASKRLPYPFCRRPEHCAGKGYCDADPACNE
jgi:hypothetical protein